MRYLHCVVGNLFSFWELLIAAHTYLISAYATARAHTDAHTRADIFPLRCFVHN